MYQTLLSRSLFVCLFFLFVLSILRLFELLLGKLHRLNKIISHLLLSLVPLECPQSFQIPHQKLVNPCQMNSLGLENLLIRQSRYRHCWFVLPQSQQKALHSTKIFHQKGVQRRHKALFLPELNQIRQILDHFDNQNQPPRHMFRWGSRNQPESHRRNQTGANQSEKEKGADRGEFGPIFVPKFVKNMRPDCSVGNFENGRDFRGRLKHNSKELVGSTKKVCTMVEEILLLVDLERI
mmetsp:Transcript_27515/g.42760  ORF Transcript_27515/g.42760 Transcript_27515/m.42760 type:complete len:237 (+) Transcript_27515:1086-1796(+)